jgi:WD40 repeat protein
MNPNGQLPQQNEPHDLAPTRRTVVPDSKESASSASGAQTNALPAVPVIPDHELLRRIGQGSYGEVWLARNVLGEYRAVKVVYRQTFQSARPFDREFEGIKKFEPISRSHESQVQILHVGRAVDDGSFYYIMELADDVGAVSSLEFEVSGSGQSKFQTSNFKPETYSPKTLRSEIQRQGRLTPDECLEIALKLTRAVGHLHQHHLVHRDIKPSNIIFVHGIPKLADIGLVAKADATLSFVGTEGFLPPEGPGKPQADLYSLGKVLYETSTGRDRQDFPELPTDLRAVADRDRLVEFNEIILKACDPSVSRRYRSAEEMHADLVLLQAGKSLKRLRTVERRFKVVTRIAAALTILGVIVTAGLLYQRRQTSLVTNLANLEATQRQRAENALTQVELARAQVELVRMSETLERGDTSLALMQLAHTLRSAPTNRFVSERLMAAINEKNFLAPLSPLQHPDQINSACFSPDARWIATASRDGAARIWSVSTGEVLNQPLQHASEVVSVQFSSDGNQIVTGSKDGLATVWDVKSGKVAGEPLKHELEVSYAEFRPDGQRILTVSGLAARVWDARSRQLVGEVMRHSDQPVSIHPAMKWKWEGGNIEEAHFSPDGNYVATASRDGTARIWDAATGKPLTVPLQHNSRGVVAPAVTSVRFSADGRRIVTASQDRTARIWNVRTGEMVGEPLQHEHPVNSACFSLDGGRVLTVSNDRTVRIWDAFTGQPLSEPLVFNSAIKRGEFSPNGSWILAQQGGRSPKCAALILNGQSGKLEFEPRDHVFDVKVAMSPGGQKILSFTGNDAWVWDALPGNVRGMIFPHDNWVGFVRFSPDGSLIVTAETDEVTGGTWFNADFAKSNSESAVWIWNARTGKRVAGPLKHQGGIISAEFSPDARRLVTASRDQTARVWAAATGQPIGAPLKHSHIVRFARFTPDGQRVITSCWMHRAWLWDASTGEMLLQFHDTEPDDDSSPWIPVRSEDISPDGKWLVTCSDGDGARIWEIATGHLLKGPFDSGGKVWAARFSPDGKRLVTASVHACIWEVETGRRLTPPIQPAERMILAQFSPDGRKIVTFSTDHTVRLWDAATGEQLTKPLKHQGEAVYAQFSPDCRRIVTSSWWDHAALLWDVETGLPLSQPLRHDNWNLYASFSPDGRWIVTAGNDRKAKLWEIPLAPLPIPEWLPDLAEALVGRRLNAQGLREHVPIEKLFALKERLVSSTATDDYTRWAKWLFADRSQRTISAFSSITIPEYVEQLVEENTLRSLEEAVRLAPTNGLAYARLARRILKQPANKIPRWVGEAEFYSRLAVKFAPENSEVRQVAAEIGR